MKITITARNADVTRIQPIIERRLERLGRFEPRASRVEVVFTGEKTEVRARAAVSIDRGADVHAEASAPDARTALDRLAEKLAGQLRRGHDRHQRRGRG